MVLLLLVVVGGSSDFAFGSSTGWFRSLRKMNEEKGKWKKKEKRVVCRPVRTRAGCYYCYYCSLVGPDSRWCPCRGSVVGRAKSA